MMREFFYLQKSDRKVVLALLIVIVIALGVIFFTSSPDISTPSRNSRASGYARNTISSPLPTRQVERFFFDPNTADSTISTSSGHLAAFIVSLWILPDFMD